VESPSIVQVFGFRRGIVAFPGDDGTPASFTCNRETVNSLSIENLRPSGISGDVRFLLLARNCWRFFVLLIASSMVFVKESCKSWP
jgi:hypothetical protein